MSKSEARNEAIRLAVERLGMRDIGSSCERLGIECLAGGSFKIRAFGSDCVVIPPNFDVRNIATGKPVRPDIAILVLHYLLCEGKIEETGELIGFRNLPGGQFYLEPFTSRTVRPLAARIGNDIGLLRKKLGRFDWTEEKMADFSASIRAVGKVNLRLLYYIGDDEMPASAEILFDSSIGKVFCTEDVAVLSSLICIGLIQ